MLPQHDQIFTVEDLLNSEDIDWVTDNIEEPPSCGRSKCDLEHQFHDLPMPKGCPKRVAVFELLIHASLVFMEDDFDKVAEFLVCKCIGPDELYEYFYFHREWWRERC
jgi:hypothetical protein